MRFVAVKVCGAADEETRGCSVLTAAVVVVGSDANEAN